MTTGVYCITNTCNGKRYIGSSQTSIEQRFKQHRNGRFSSSYLQNSIQKYGIENFKFDVLLECQSDRCLCNEQYYITLLRPEYNLSLIVGKGTFGTKRTKESIESSTQKNTGQIRSDESKKKMSMAQKEFLKTHSNNFLGKHHTEKTKERLSVARKGRKLTPEHVKKISDANKGYIYPDSQRRNLSASIKAWWAKRKNVLEVEDAIP